MATSMNADALGQAQGLFEPQRQNNWTITFPDLIIPAGEEAITLSLESGALPNVTIDPVEMHFMNSMRSVAGKVTYETIPLVLKDMVDVGVAQSMDAWLKTVYDPFTDRVGLAKTYKKRGIITLSAPDGTYERTWNLVGCWPTAVNFGTLDMTSADTVKLEMTLKYDKAYGSLAVGEGADGLVENLTGALNSVFG